MKIDCHLVIVKKRGKEPKVARVTQTRPALAADESVVKLQLDIPSDVFDTPLVTVPVERRQIAVAVEVDEV